MNKFGLISGGFTVVGGFAYRGSAIPDLQGKYVFGDMGRSNSDAQQGNRPRLFYGDLQTGETFQFEFDESGADLAGKILLSIGEDDKGELYVVAGDDPGYYLESRPDGVILRILARPSHSALNDERR